MAAGAAGATILVVECAEIRALLRLMLEKQGYRVVQSDVEHAASVLEGKENAVCALVTNTPQYFLRFGRLPILYIAAVPDPGLIRYCSAVLRKPFTFRDLADSIKAVLASAPITGKPPSSEAGGCGSAKKSTSGAI